MRCWIPHGFLHGLSPRPGELKSMPGTHVYMPKKFEEENGGGILAELSPLRSEFSLSLCPSLSLSGEQMCPMEKKWIKKISENISSSIILLSCFTSGFVEKVMTTHVVYWQRRHLHSSAVENAERVISVSTKC